MKIGFDLDGVIFDTEKSYRTYSEIYDLNVLKRNSIINSSEVKLQNRYNWTKEEQTDFFNKYNLKIFQEATIMPGCKEVLRLLHSEGHELILITALGLFVKEGQELTEKVFKQNKICVFNKCYWDVSNKKEICESENIDIFVDDYDKECIEIASSKNNVIYLKDAESASISNNQYVKTLYNWGELYRYIKNLKH